MKTEAKRSDRRDDGTFMVAAGNCRVSYGQNVA